MCVTHTHTHKWSNTAHREPALRSLLQPTHWSPITLTQGYLISQDVYRLFLDLLTLLWAGGRGGFCNGGGGRSLPWDEGVSQNQEALDLAEGYFEVKRFLNCRGDQRRWLPAPKAVRPDKHPAKLRLELGGHGWIGWVHVCIFSCTCLRWIEEWGSW